MRRVFQSRLRAACAGPALLLLMAVGASAQSLTQVGTIGNFTGTAQMLEVGDDGFNITPTKTNYSSAFGVSGDGTTLVGDSVTASGFGHAIIFTAKGGIIDLGSLTPTGAAVALSASADGSIVVGFGQVPGGTWHGFRWTQSTGMVDLGTLVTGNAGYSFATGISADGSVIAGGSFTNTSIDRATRWTVGTGWVNLGTLTGGSGFSDAYGISADGTTIVGFSTSLAGPTHAFCWTQPAGMVDLGTIGGANGASLARAADADGGVIVGYSAIPGGASHAFRWQSGTMSDLGTIGGGPGNSNALAVNSDGSIVVGSSSVGAATHAFLWTQASAMQDLNILLAAAGVNMSGVTLTRASGLSSDGNTIVGSGTFPNTGVNTQAYVARLITTPSGTIGGVTTPSAVLAGINQLAASQQAQIMTKNMLASLLTGRNQQINCAACAGAMSTAGSLTGGVDGRFAIADWLSALGGLSYGEYTDSQGDVHVTGSTTLAGSLRVDPASWGWSRPFAEIGTAVTPHEDTQLSRHYLNGAGTATGMGQTSDHGVVAFVRTGWVFRISPRDEAAGTLGVSRSWQMVKGYSEALTASNPFPATSSPGTNIMNVATIGAQYTRLVTDKIEASVNLDVERSFGSKDGITTTIAGVVSAQPSPHEYTWYDYGVRFGYRVTTSLTVDLFVDGSVAPHAIGNQVHGGVGLRFYY